MIKAFVRKAVGPNLYAKLHAVKESYQRFRMRTHRRIYCDTSRLGSLSMSKIQSMFSDETSTKDWHEDVHHYTQVGLERADLYAGVNPGDRRAIYHLVRGLKPRSVLEVGTNVGASTLAMALAALRNRKEGVPTSIVTIDVLDVRDQMSHWWERYGARISPLDAIRTTGAGDIVEFNTASSAAFLRGDPRKFDLVFLDGSHVSIDAYREMPAAINALNAGGIVLLHDYYPDLRRVYSDGDIIDGPYLAGQRFLKENADAEIRPLGGLPWPTRSGTRATTLALLVGRDRS